jgi:hypothetical protein
MRANCIQVFIFQPIECDQANWRETKGYTKQVNCSKIDYGHNLTVNFHASTEEALLNCDFNSVNFTAYPEKSMHITFRDHTLYILGR